MKTAVISALALGAMTSLALAAEPAKQQPPAKSAPVVLTEVQMDQVAAGQVGICVACANVAAAIAANLLSTGSEATATTGDQAINIGTGG